MEDGGFINNFIIKREIEDSLVGICCTCGNESIYTKDEKMICGYCQEYYENALKYDVDRLMLYISVKYGMPKVKERRGSLDNYGNFAGKTVCRCVNCGAFQYSTGSSMCSCCGAGAVVGDKFYSLADGYMCKACLQVVDDKKEICKGCSESKDRRLIPKFMNSFVGRVYNNLQIVKQYRTPAGILCDLKCLWPGCKEVYTAVPLYEVVKAKVYCTNPKEFMSVYCDGCGNIARLNNAEVYPRDHKCKKCGIEIGLNLRLYANDAEKYTDFKVKYLQDTYGYGKEIRNGVLIKNTELPDVYKVVPIWNTRHLIMDSDEIENSQFRLGGKVGDGLFSTDVIWCQREGFLWS